VGKAEEAALYSEPQKVQAAHIEGDESKVHERHMLSFAENAGSSFVMSAGVVGLAISEN
jgi:hypothetical protein